MYAFIRTQLFLLLIYCVKQEHLCSISQHASPNEMRKIDRTTQEAQTDQSRAS